MLHPIHRQGNSAPPTATPAGAADNGTTASVQLYRESPAEPTVNGSPAGASRSDGTPSPGQLDPELHRALMALIRRKGGQITARQLQRANPRKYPTRDAAEAALDALVRAGLGRWVVLPTAKRAQVTRAVLLCDSVAPSPEPRPAVASTPAVEPVPDAAPGNCRAPDKTCPDCGTTNKSQDGGEQAEAAQLPSLQYLVPQSGQVLSGVPDTVIRSAWLETPPTTRCTVWNQAQADELLDKVNAALGAAFKDHGWHWGRSQQLGLLTLGIFNTYAWHDVAFWEAYSLVQSVLDAWKTPPPPSGKCVRCGRPGTDGDYVCPVCIQQIRDKAAADLKAKPRCRACGQPGSISNLGLCEECMRNGPPDLDLSGESFDDLDDKPAAGPPGTDPFSRGQDSPQATGESQAGETPGPAGEREIEHPGSPGDNLVME